MLQKLEFKWKKSLPESLWSAAEVGIQVESDGKKDNPENPRKDEKLPSAEMAPGAEFPGLRLDAAPTSPQLVAPFGAAVRGCADARWPSYLGPPLFPRDVPEETSEKTKIAWPKNGHAKMLDETS